MQVFFERMSSYTETGRTNTTEIDMENSEETLTFMLKDMLLPKIILINHEKELPVDTACANLALKYNMLYISIHQIIKEHIEKNT